MCLKQIKIMKDMDCYIRAYCFASLGSYWVRKIKAPTLCYWDVYLKTEQIKTIISVY